MRLFITELAKIFEPATINGTIFVENLTNSPMQDLKEIYCENHELDGFSSCFDLGNIQCEKPTACECQLGSLLSQASILAQLNTTDCSESHQQQVIFWANDRGVDLSIEQPFGFPLLSSRHLIHKILASKT